jgi:hypothetical protein
MSSGADGYSVYVALILTAVAAVMSAHSQPGEPYQKLQWLISATSSPGAIAVAGTTDENLGFPQP